MLCLNQPIPAPFTSNIVSSWISSLLPSCPYVTGGLAPQFESRSPGGFCFGKPLLLVLDTNKNARAAARRRRAMLLCFVLVKINAMEAMSGAGDGPREL